VPVPPALLSVNVGRPREARWAGIGRTSIHKTPVNGPVGVRGLGLDGDQVSDTKHHGGPDQAVYAFAREDLDLWAERLGRPIADGWFGENLTTRGIDVNEAEVGERWRVGTALLEVASIRTPCNDFKSWMGLSGYDNTHWVKRFALEARPGPYLRVLEEGSLQAGDEIIVVHRPGHGVTVSEMFRALNLDHSLLPRLLLVDGLAERARARVEAYAGSR
jgi:MOSC domain-containing protein YiiM